MIGVCAATGHSIDVSQSQGQQVIKISKMTDFDCGYVQSANRGRGYVDCARALGRGKLPEAVYLKVLEQTNRPKACVVRTLLCESTPITRLLPSVKGYDSPTNFSAAVVFAVKMTVYSLLEALKKDKTAARASSAYCAESLELSARHPTSGAGSNGPEDAYAYLLLTEWVFPRILVVRK